MAETAKPTVLLVLDDETERSLVVPALTAEGWDVGEVQGPESALHALDQGAQAVIIYERVDGYRGTELLVQLHHRRVHAPVLFVTHEPMDADAASEMRRAHGLSELLSEPLSPAILVQHVRHALTARPVPLDALAEQMQRLKASYPRKLSRPAIPIPTLPGRPTVLVVDDELTFLNEVRKYGRGLALNVTTATTSEAALERARAQRIDAAVIDAVLEQGESGFALAATLRTLPGYSDLPIGAVSSDATMPSRIAAAHAGASVFLEKPLDEPTFGDAVRRLLESSRGGDSTVLVVDDDPSFAEDVRNTLAEHGCTVHYERNPLRLLEVLSQVRPDVLLLDDQMPEMSGIEACRVLRAADKWRDLAVVFASTSTSVDDHLACFRAGGDDCISKPLLPEELVARVGVRIERARWFRERTQRDQLTGLLSRKAFSDAVDARVSDARRRERQLAIIMLDVDGFKSVNDEHGHLVGDRVLASLGRLLRARFRNVDLRGRWGGEEFVIALNEESGDSAAAVVARVLREFGEESFLDDAGQPFHVSFSAGVATFPEDGKGLKQLLRAADQRMYDAKRAGGARVMGPAGIAQ